MLHVITSNVAPQIPAQTVTSASYRIDQKASLFTVRAFADGLISAAAHNPQFAIRDFTGDVQLGVGQSNSSGLSLHMKSGHFDLMDDISAADRRAIEHVMNHEVLEIEHYPDISYQSNSIALNQISEALFHVEIVGHLVLHGVRQRLVISSEVVLGDATLRATGSFAIRQTDFGIKIASVAGGTLKIQDQLRFCFYILARRTGIGVI